VAQDRAPAGTSVTVDPELCIGSAECVRLLPTAFRLDDSRGVSVALPGAASAGQELLAGAVEACPTRAIHVVK
jgi:ferredoxin